MDSKTLEGQIFSTGVLVFLILVIVVVPYWLAVGAVRLARPIRWLSVYTILPFLLIAPLASIQIQRAYAGPPSKQSAWMAFVIVAPILIGAVIFVYWIPYFTFVVILNVLHVIIRKRLFPWFSRWTVVPFVLLNAIGIPSVWNAVMNGTGSFR